MIAARRHVHREYGVDPQARVRVDDVMTRNVRAIPAHAALHAVTAEWFGPAQEHRAFPVVDLHGKTCTASARSAGRAADR